MIELNLLRAFTNKANLDSFKHLVNPKVLSKQSLLLIKDFLIYQERFPSENIDLGDFKSFFFIEKHSDFDDKQIAEYTEIFDRLAKIPPNSEKIGSLVASFEQQELYSQLHEDLDRNMDIASLSQKIELFKSKTSQLQSLSDEMHIDMDLEAALKFTDRSGGLQWRLNCLREHFNGGLIKGDFGIIAGYVDSGKTSFLASEISYMAEQLTGDQWIAWLNTEGNWEQIVPRIYQATLNCTEQDLKKWTKDAIVKYKDKMHGNGNRIRVLNYQRKSTQDVEALIKTNPPSLIVFDLLDHIQGFDKYLGKDGSATERYGALYQWARTIATTYCPVLAISQLNGDGNNEPYPSITALRGSRVDKQGAATFQLVIGGLEGNSTERYLSMPKNKVSSNKGWRTAVKFDPLRSRFEG